MKHVHNIDEVEGLNWFSDKIAYVNRSLKDHFEQFSLKEKCRPTQSVVRCGITVFGVIQQTATFNKEDNTIEMYDDLLVYVDCRWDMNPNEYVIESTAK